MPFVAWEEGNRPAEHPTYACPERPRFPPSEQSPDESESRPEDAAIDRENQVERKCSGHEPAHSEAPASAQEERRDGKARDEHEGRDWGRNIRHQPESRSSPAPG